MGAGSFAYKFVFMLHILCIVVGFGTSFLYPVLASKARALPPNEGYAVNHTAFSVSKYLTTYPIYAAGVFGLTLVILSDKAYTFSQTWVSVAFVLFFIAVLFAGFVHVPNLKAMDELSGKLARGEATPSKEGPPKEVLELQERGPRAGMYGGLLHLLFLLLVIDMIWKPGLG
jgi:hypothetical protein